MFGVASLTEETRPDEAVAYIGTYMSTQLSKKKPMLHNGGDGSVSHPHTSTVVIAGYTLTCVET